MNERRMKPWLLPVIAALVVVIYAMGKNGLENPFFIILYYVPSAFVLGALVNERFDMVQSNKVSWFLDGIVVLICVSRPLFAWPAASGHAVLFVYALLRCSTTSAKILSLLLGVVTFYAKIWLWHGDPSLWSGLCLGGILGLLYRYHVPVLRR